MTITDTPGAPAGSALSALELDQAIDALADRACTRCRGTGNEPGNGPIPRAWRSTLGKLIRAGRVRDENHLRRGGESAHEYEKALTQIVRVWWTEALPKGIAQGLAADAAGLSRPHFHNIINGRVNDPGLAARLVALIKECRGE